MTFQFLLNELPELVRSAIIQFLILNVADFQTTPFAIREDIYFGFKF